MRRTSFFLAFAAVLLAAGQACADPLPLLTGAGTNPIVAGFNGQVGAYFTVKNDFSVVALGVWDEGSNGLAGSHTVSIFERTGVSGSPNPNFPVFNSIAVAQVLVPSLQAATLLGEFRYVNLGTPVLLQKDHTYVLLATYAENVDSYRAYGGSGPPFDSTLVNTPLGRAWTYSTIYPPNYTNIPEGAAEFGVNLGSYVGPNLLAGPATTPEPSTVISLIAMSAFGICAGALNRRRRQNG